MEKRWRWAVFLAKKNKTGSDSVPGLSKTHGLGSFFVMTVKTTNGVN